MRTWQAVGPTASATYNVAADRQSPARLFAGDASHHAWVASACAVFLLFAAFALWHRLDASGTQLVGVHLAPPVRPVPAAYFGMHLHRALPYAPGEPKSIWPRNAGFSAVRLWDAHVAWPDLEPKRNEWQFGHLDSLIALAEFHNARVLLTLGLTPGWASSRPAEPSAYQKGNQAPPRQLEDWRRYVDTVARRYRGRVEAYEVWNEPNQPGFFSGSIDDLVQLAKVARDAISQADPTALVTTPSPTGRYRGAKWLDTYLGRGGGQFMDVVAFHFYVSPYPADSMIPVLDSVEAVLRRRVRKDVPIWNTEIGWNIQNRTAPFNPRGPRDSFDGVVLDSSASGATIAQTLMLAWCGGVSRTYWYAWDNRRMGLIEPNGRTLKSAAVAFRAVSAWLTGAKVTSCDRSTGGTWIVRLENISSRQAIVWHEAGLVQFQVPADWRVIGATRLSDDRRRIAPIRRGVIELGAEPVLLTTGPASRTP